MPGLLAKSIDRELGPASEQERRRVASESWTPDWPLLLGLLISAALIVGSTAVVGNSHRHKPSRSGERTASRVSSIPSSAVNVGDDPAAAPTDDKPARKARSAPVRHARRTHAPSTGHAGASSPSAGSEPEPTTTPSPSPGRAGSSGRSRAGTTGGGGRTVAPVAPIKPISLVNVTGTSAAFTNGPVSYRFSAPTHAPVVGQKWPLRVSAQRSGKPLSATVKIDIVHNGAIVGHAATGALRNGSYARNLDWPDQSVGYPLVVKTSVSGGGIQQTFLFKVKVVRGAG